MVLHLLTLPTGTMPQWISNAQTAVEHDRAGSYERD